MYQIPDAPWIAGAERYGTAYTAAWRWGGRPDDYDDPYEEFEDEYDDDDIECEEEEEEDDE